MMIHAIGPHTPGTRIRGYTCFIFLFFLVGPELGSGPHRQCDAFRAKASASSHFCAFMWDPVSGFATRLAYAAPLFVHAAGTLSSP